MKYYNKPQVYYSKRHKERMNRNSEPRLLAQFIILLGIMYVLITTMLFFTQGLPW